MKSVSVHIVTYNSAVDIADCLDSVRRQTYPTSRIIVVDNDSSDNTVEIVEKYSKVTLLRNYKNVGFAAAHNQAISLSDSDYFLVLNPDVVLHPDYIFQIISTLSERGDIGSITGMLLSKANPEIIDSTGLIITKARRAFDRGAGQPCINWSQPAEVFGVSGAAAVYSRQMVKEISYEGQFFDETFFAYKEDVDVAWRSQNFGWRSLYVPSAVAFHERGWKSGKRKDQPLFIRRHSYINRYRLILKNDAFTYLALHFFRVFIYECLSFGYTILFEPRLLVSWLDLICDLPSIWRKRSFVKKRINSISLSEIYRFFM